jgi:hypothetical protein
VPKILLWLMQLSLIARILIYFAGVENARQHWMRVTVYVVLIAVFARCFQWYFGKTIALLFVMTHI